MKTSTFTLGLAVLALPLFAGADDWRMWGGNANRGGIVESDLPEELVLQWRRELPTPKPAWPASQTKLQFDAAVQPIVVGKLLVVGSTVNDSVAAYDTTTGELVWRFFTEGPIRFAPAATADKICVGSDDGWLYCLAAQTGELVWKLQGGPTTRRIIGNDRLISTWPVRGGPVVADNTVYFTAGVWPFMGVFVHAVDIETGEKIWTNSETGSTWITHPHGAPSFGSIAPQGYMAVAGDYLIAPGGRSLPAVFDRKTGKLLHFDFGGKSSGGWNVIANTKMFNVGRESFTLDNRAAIGKSPIDLLSDTMIVSGDTLQTLDEKSISQQTVTDRRGEKTKQWKLSPAAARKIGDDSFRPLFIAGDSLFASKDDTIARFDIKGKEGSKPTWSTKIQGNVVGAVTGDDKLFVVEESGQIYCYGKGEPEKSVVYDFVDDEQVKDGEPGYVVSIGINHELAIKYARSSNLHVVFIDNDAAAVQQFRETMTDTGLYGTHVTAIVGDITSAKLLPYFAKKIIVQQSIDSKEELQTNLAGVTHALRPYGGEARLNVSADFPAEQRKELAKRGFAVEVNDEHYQITRRGPLPQSGTWTHQYADAGNSVVSQDALVKAPLGVLWFGGPPNDDVLPRHGHGPSPQVAGGRLVIEGADMLRAVDVYTGQLLWQRDLPNLGKYYDTTRHFAGAGEIGGNYVTLPDAIYVAYGPQLLELDPANGKTRRSFDLATAEDSWGFIASAGDILVATSSPVSVGKSAKTNVSNTLKPIIKTGATWQYLAGEDPPADWKDGGFKLSDKWETGAAGFGYGDGDDKTVLTNMRGKFARVYIRTTFTGDQLGDAKKLTLSVNYDDAFIAYLNGHEIARVGVGKNAGAEAKDIKSHEADKHETFEIADFRKHLVEGENVLAIEGHNVSLTSSDFTLEPALFVESKSADVVKQDPKKISDFLEPVKYSSASKRLVVRDRNSGDILWQRTAEMNFRHNSIVIAGDFLYCIDALSDDKLATLKRRGLEPTTKARLLALHAKTGDVVWSTDENVFGTFLSYSIEHDLLLQAGSAYRDRASDESGKGMIVYRAKTGEVVWQDLNRSHGGPCLLWKDRIITNGGGGEMFDLLTGKSLDWKYTRMYGCNTAVGSQNLLTFRSGAAGFCDLAGDSGTGNIGGFRSSCTANLIVADGVLNAPDYTRTCVCAYQNQCSLAMVHMPEAEMWTFSSLSETPETFAINLGAPGDRRDPSGAIWYEFPIVGGKSPDLGIQIEGKEARTIRRHASIIKGDSNLPWVASSAIANVQKIVLKTPSASEDRPQKFDLQLYFAELENALPGERVFTVVINGEKFLADFDIAKSAAMNELLVKTISNVHSKGEIVIELKSQTGEPCLSGISATLAR